MSDQIKYNFGQIEALRADLAASAANLDSTLNDLKGYVSSLAASWDSNASANYQAQQRRWDDAALNLKLILDAVGRAVGEGNDQMRDAERAAAQQWA
ncbi:WXG100 family type VII secretion target [Hoyosella sp. G463]|uniref:ESAT-6-like protein n=1 Tax=Lolliginicoccus lacisalsi TaxID=2742202 RepID=A0A927PKU8_9ACTN|nr:WXG100 family type VII secretion target [Lolliginicoccus lacisalsi]MBD8506420.1 WXG100 family type VII secretion target [Lolliginicoccus lacisalsi]